MSRNDVRALARGLAAAEVGVPVPPVREPLDADTWGMLETVVRAERLAPQLAVATATGRLAATPAQRAAAEDMHRSAMASAVLLDRMLLDVADRFDAAGIPLVVLKGAAVAHLDYVEPSRRAYGDVDVLVPSSHIDRAVACLSATGASRTYREPRPGFDRRFTKGMSFRMPSGFEVDVHRTLVLGPFGLTVDLDDLFAGRDTFTIGGRSFEALDRNRRFLHAAMHAVLGRARARLVPLMDMVLTAPRTDADMGAVVALARRWDADLVLLEAVDAASTELGWAPPNALLGWLDHLQPTARQRRWLAAYRGRGRSSARLSLLAVEALDDWSDRLAYLHALLLPSNTSGPSIVRRLGRGVDSLRRTREHEPR